MLAFQNGSGWRTATQPSALRGIPTDIALASGQTAPGLTVHQFGNNGQGPLIAAFLASGNTSRLTADSAAISATSAATAVTQFNFSNFPSTANGQTNTNYSFHCGGFYVQSNGNAAVGIAIQSSGTNPVSLSAGAMIGISPTSVGTGTSGKITNQTYTTVAAPTGAGFGTVFPWSLDGGIEVGGTSPTLNIGFYTGNAADTIIVKQDSYCAIYPS